MTDEQIDRIFEALDNGTKKAGYKNFEEAMAGTADWLGRIAKDAKSMSTRASARRWLRKTFPNPNPDEIKFLLRLLPVLPYVMRRAGPGFAKLLPHPPGGRPSAMKPALHQEVFDQITELHVKKGVPLMTVYKRLGQRYRLSPRTIQRIWTGRPKSIKP